MKTPLSAPVALRAIERRFKLTNDTSSRATPCRRGAKAPRCTSFFAATANARPENVGADQEDAKRQAGEHRQHHRDGDDATNELEPFVEDEHVDRDADVAQRRPGQIERNVEEEQRQLGRSGDGRSGSRQHDSEAEKRRGKRQDRIEQDDGCHLAGDLLVLAAGKVRAPQIDEQNIREAEVGEPQRVTDRPDHDEDREALRRENPRQHEGLDEACRHCAARGGKAQQRIADRNKPPARQFGDLPVIGKRSDGACMTVLARRDRGRQ